MSGTTSANQFQVFAGGTGANTLTPANYASLAAVSTGFQSGIAQSVQANTVWRQCSTIAAMIGQFIVNNSGQQALDTGNITTLLANFQTAVQTASGRIKLTSNMNFYVSPSGSDTNTGTSASNPFLTIQAAYNYIANNYDLAGFDVGIVVANGTYANGLTAFAPIVGQNGPVYVTGNPSSPASVVINSSPTETNTFASLNGAWLQLTGMTINSSGTGQGGYCIVSQTGGQTNFNTIVFGNAVAGHIDANYGGFTGCNGNYTISGSAPVHIQAGAGQINYDGLGGTYTITVTLTGTPNFSNAFCNSTVAGNLTLAGVTFVGNATGQRYNCSYGGSISTGTGNPNYLPGNIAGTTNTAGVNGGYYN